MLLTVTGAGTDFRTWLELTPPVGSLSSADAKISRHALDDPTRGVDATELEPQVLDRLGELC